MDGTVNRAHVDATCPHCKGDLCLYDEWNNAHDCSTDWRYTCPHCEKELNVTVEAQPTFIVQIR
jgi:transposase-like protein